jgi:hypothetical protein
MGLSTLILVHFRLHFSLNPKKSGKVIHRVVVEPRGIITKGDNLAWVDDWTLQPGDILGKVVAIHRQGRALPVPKHAPASLYLLKARRWCDRAASRFLQPVYHRLARSGLLRGRLGQWMRPQLLYFSRADGPEWQLWLGNLFIGRKLPSQAHWTIHRPFRLFVDETTLPHELPASSVSNKQCAVNGHLSAVSSQIVIYSFIAHNKMGTVCRNGRFGPQYAITFNIGGTYVIPPRLAVDIVAGNRPELQGPGCQLASPAAEFGQVKHTMKPIQGCWLEVSRSRRR